MQLVGLTKNVVRVVQESLESQPARIFYRLVDVVNYSKCRPNKHLNVINRPDAGVERECNALHGTHES